MLNFKARIFAGVLFVFFLGGVVLPAEPKVVESIPANEAEDVDPGLQEIVVVFDQDMTTGRNFSVCGGGEKFPKIIGNPRWRDKRTIVMKIRLEANHEYSFSINCPSAKGFMSASGEPAEVYPVGFKTGSGTGAGTIDQSAAKKADPAQAVKELRRVIDEEYSYRDIRAVDWDRVFTENEKLLIAAKNSDEFARAASTVLAEAKDKHIWLTAGEKQYGCYKHPVKPNMNFKKLGDFVPGFTKRSSVVYTGRFVDGTGYIMINGWEKNNEEALEQVYEAIWDFTESPGLIIDVRGNGGGSEPLAQQVAGCFVNKPFVYGKHVYRDVNAESGFGKINERVLVPNKRRPRYRGKIAVLMGPVNMSSCEAFLLMMKQVPGCLLVGERSQGSSGNPKGHELGNGVTVFVPSWKALLPNGECFEGIGIEPDIEIKVTDEQLQNSDPVLEAAIKLVRTR